MKTKQEVFMQVATHLLKQNAQSIKVRGDGSSSNHCAYRGNDGLQCAVGCLIPDQFYTPGLEGHDVHDNAVREALLDSGIDMHDDDIADLLSSLQQMHDNYAPTDWRTKITKIGERFGLAVANIAFI